jgi:hypothetical protein
MGISIEIGHPARRSLENVRQLVGSMSQRVGGNMSVLRKRRKCTSATPTAIQAVPPAPKPALQISTPNSLPVSEKPSRGPHIAKVELLPASELNY